MGTQAYRFKSEVKRFYANILEVMRTNEEKDWHLVLVVLPDFNEEDFGVISGNVSVVKWVSQIEVLRISSMAITHGGLGTTKECIFYGVPMIVFPLGRDQYVNAKRVHYHKLGLEMDLDSLTASELERAILHLLTSSTIKESVGKMKAVFREREEAQIGAKFIESVLRENKNIINFRS
jgi:MGT family glycosyltransferase